MKREKCSGRVWFAAGMTGLLIGGLLFLAAPGFSQEKSWPRFEIDLRGGYGMTQFEGSSTYSRQWGFKYIESVTEYDNILMKAEDGFSLGAGFSYFFTPGLGLQLGGGSFSSNLPGDGLFNTQWKWKGDPETYQDGGTWRGGGQRHSIPLYLNLVVKLRTRVVDLSLSVGPTVYFNRLRASSSIGFSDLFYEEEWFRGFHFEYIGVENYIIPERIGEANWTSFGGNAGIGIDFKVLPQVSVGLEGRYFLVPNKSLSWEWTPGSYFLLGGASSTEYTAADLAEFESLQTPIEVKPSFFSLSVVFKYAFGLR